MPAVKAIDPPEARRLTPEEARARYAAELHVVFGPGWTADRFCQAVESGEADTSDERIMRLILLLPLVGWVPRFYPAKDPWLSK